MKIPYRGRLIQKTRHWPLALRPQMGARRQPAAESPILKSAGPDESGP